MAGGAFAARRTRTSGGTDVCMSKATADRMWNIRKSVLCAVAERNGVQLYNCAADGRAVHAHRSAAERPRPSRAADRRPDVHKTLPALLSSVRRWSARVCVCSAPLRTVGCCCCKLRALLGCLQNSLALRVWWMCYSCLSSIASCFGSRCATVPVYSASERCRERASERTYITLELNGGTGGRCC